MKFPRCGILLHTTPLPGRLGVGGLGQSAYQCVAFGLGRLEFVGLQRALQVFRLAPRH